MLRCCSVISSYVMSLKINVYQGSTSLNTNTTLELNEVLKGRKSIGRIAATIATEVFDNARYYKSVGSRLFSGREPVLVRITMDGKVIDFGDESGKVTREMQQKLKIQISDAGEKRFGQLVFKHITFAVRNPTAASDVKVKSFEFGK